MNLRYNFPWHALPRKWNEKDNGHGFYVVTVIIVIWGDRKKLENFSQNGLQRDSNMCTNLKSATLTTKTKRR